MTIDETIPPDLLLALQRGLPLVPRPFAAIGERSGIGETAVLECAAGLIARGAARRFGAVFDSRSLGYDSTLCAVDVPQERIEAAAALLTPHPGITHCYEREGRPNLWFTFTAQKALFAAERDELADALRPYELLDLPALRTFKIEAVFDTRLVGGQPGMRAAPRRARGPDTPKAIDPRERGVVRRLQGSIPLVPEPFAVLGEELGRTPESLLALLTRWQQTGILRRIGLIVRHRELGFAANGMCVWAADSAQVTEAGRILAGFPEVTHCYERRPHARFSFNLFAMVHTGSREGAQSARERLSAAAGVIDGLLLLSGREFKKSSPRFFEEA